MQINFFKYQGTGNDFILIDNREVQVLGKDDRDKIAFLCDRRFGIGADGLMLLQEREGYDFEMVYFNADGRESSMCGNGGRCIVAFARHLGLIDEQSRFLAIDGPHEAIIDSNNWVQLQMGTVDTVQQKEDYYYLDTGSPHYVRFVEDLEALDIIAEGRQIRYAPQFAPGGTNANFVRIKEEGIEVATYERGVEGETLSCGTGVTAAAIAYYLEKDRKETNSSIPIQTKGGKLEVRFRATGTTYSNIWLCGPAVKVFEGQITLD